MFMLCIASLCFMYSSLGPECFGMLFCVCMLVWACVHVFVSVCVSVCDGPGQSQCQAGIVCNREPGALWEQQQQTPLQKLPGEELCANSLSELRLNREIIRTLSTNLFKWNSKAQLQSVENSLPTHTCSTLLQSPLMDNLPACLCSPLLRAYIIQSRPSSPPLSCSLHL